MLIQISDVMPNNDEDASETIKKLSDHFKREKESAVRVKVLALFNEMVIECSTDGIVLIEEIMTLLADEKSPKVIFNYINLDISL